MATDTVEVTMHQQNLLANIMIATSVVFPNPSTGQFSVRIKYSRAVTSTIHIVELATGIQIKTDNYPENTSIEQQYDITNASRGVYAIQLQADGQSYVVQIIKL